MVNETAVLLFSAGQDSATCLAWALNRYARVETIGFDYGQRHAIELTQRPKFLAAARALKPAWDQRLGGDVVVDMRGFGALAHSALTADGDIGAMRRGLPASFVPGRNLAFLIFAAARAWLSGATVLVTGVCETDYSGYPDCRQETIDAMAGALRLGLAAPVTIETPLMHLTKAQTWALAAEEGPAGFVELIRTETHTCYEGVRDELHPWGYGCGVCPACSLRRAGWDAYREGQSA